MNEQPEDDKFELYSELRVQLMHRWFMTLVSAMRHDTKKDGG